MTNGRPAAFGFWLALTAVVVVAAAAGVYMYVLREPFAVESAVVRASIVALLCVLFVLLVRYFVLLWFAFLTHLESAGIEGWEHEPLVSVIVPAFNEQAMIEAGIRSLVRLDYARLEIVIVDDGSSDATYRYAVGLARNDPRVAVRVVTQANTGKASALNRGLAAARGDYLAFVDSDSTLAPGSLRAAMRHFRDPYVGAVAGNIKVANRVNLLTWLQALEYVEGLNLVRSAQGFFRLVNIVPGPLGVFRREALLGVGGCSSDTYAEDCDLTLALLGRGWKIRYEPRAIAYTEAPERTSQLLRQRYRWTRGILQALRKHRGLLFGRRSNLGARLTVLYMLFEAIVWPVANVLANVFLLAIALYWGVGRLLVLWWMQLTLLDMVGALFSVAAEREDFRLVPLAVIYRLSYILLIDLAKCLATIEEAAGLSMTWGKLERLGRLP
jgi:biofilm PGA synthesis N-glycosyltransferase PgaC